MSRQLTIVLVLYILGIAVGYAELVPVSALAAIGLAALMLGLISVINTWQNTRLYFYVVSLVLGAVVFQWHTQAARGNVEGLAGCPARFTGTVCEEPDIRPNYINYVVKIEKVETTADIAGRIPDEPAGRVLLTVGGEGQTYSYGDRLQFTAIPLLPDEPGIPGEFNYRKFLLARGIQLTVKSWQGSGVQKVGTGGINYFVDACIRCKEELMSVTRATLAPRYAGLLQGVLFGSCGLIDNQTRNDFALAGVVHILSVSGFHVAMMMGICLLLVDKLRMNRYAGTAFTVIVTLAYTVMSGAGPPAVRALIMGWTLLLARSLKREYDWVSSLSLAALILLIIDPGYLADAGFQLSFAATWGVLYLAPQITHILKLLLTPADKNQRGLPRISPDLVKKQGVWRWLGQSVGITVAAQLAVLPITSYYFNYFALLAVPSNLVIVPLTTLVMLLGGLAAISGLIWLPLADVINVSTGFITELILRAAHWLAALPFATIVVEQPAIFEITGFYLVLFLAAEAWKNPAVSLRIRRIYLTNYQRLIPIGLFAAACLLWFSIAAPGEKGIELTFLDIGQGDAAVLECPGGFSAVFDTGGAPEMTKSSYNPGERILMPFLRRKGISRIDVLLLSHAHADHIQGAEFLVNNIPVKMLVIGGQFTADPAGARLVKAFKAKGTKIQEVSGGDRLWFDEKTTMDVLSPPDRLTTDVNDDSLVVRLCYGELHVLLTGDAGTEVLDNLPDLSKLQAEIVKVPHHGSKNSWSEAFYRAVDPDAAVISVGPNYFGHPAGQVLRGLGQLGVACYRTDRNGAIIVTSNGCDYQIRTGRSQRAELN